MFWGKERTADCQEILLGPNDKSYVNHLGNLITLSSQAHLYWNDGVFALKHIRGGSYLGTTEMVLELEWLAKHPELGRLVSADQAVEDISIQQSADHILTSVRTRRELYSGDHIT